MHLEMSFAKWWPFCIGLIVLQNIVYLPTMAISETEVGEKYNRFLSLCFHIQIPGSIVTLAAEKMFELCRLLKVNGTF